MQSFLFRFIYHLFYIFIGNYSSQLDMCVCVCALFSLCSVRRGYICRALVVVIPHILWIYWSEPNQVKMMLRNEMLLATATSEYAAVVLGAMRNECAMMRFVLFHWKRWLILFDVWAHLSETYDITRIEHERNNNNRFNASTKRFPFHLFFFLIVIISVVKHVFACFDASLQFVCSRVYAKMLFNCLC